MDSASHSLFAWLEDQSNFDLFDQVKSALRDLLVLAKKTKFADVETLVKEQDRLVDIISQEPAFLTDNVINTLQHNMGSITESVIELYGTTDTAEELELDATRSPINTDLEAERGAMVIFDDMDVSELDYEVEFDDGVEIDSTSIARDHARASGSKPDINAAVFDAFVEECAELIQMAKSYQQQCHNNLDDREAIRNLRRVYHTLKGSSRMVELESVGELSNTL